MILTTTGSINWIRNYYLFEQSCFFLLMRVVVVGQRVQVQRAVLFNNHIHEIIIYAGHEWYYLQVASTTHTGSTTQQPVLILRTRKLHRRRRSCVQVDSMQLVQVQKPTPT